MNNNLIIDIDNSKYFTKCINDLILNNQQLTNRILKLENTVTKLQKTSNIRNKKQIIEVLNTKTNIPPNIQLLITNVFLTFSKVPFYRPLDENPSVRISR